jgi:hypothetical protein
VIKSLKEKTMERIVMTSMFVLVSFAAFAILEDPPLSENCSRVSENVSKLLASWKQAAGEGKTRPTAEREQVQARIASLARGCPVGSRVGPSLVVARDLLAALKAGAEANAEVCPLATVAPELKTTEPFASGEALARAHGKLVHELLELASHASAGLPGSSRDASAKSGAAANGQAPGAVRIAPQEDVAARLVALKTSWESLPDEIATLPAARRREMASEFASLGRSCKTVALLPSTVLALSEGFDTLDALNVKLGEWAQANAPLFRSVPEEAKKAFASNAALVRQSREILRRAAEIVKASAAAASEPPPALEEANEVSPRN